MAAVTKNLVVQSQLHPLLTLCGLGQETELVYLDCPRASPVQ